MSCNETVGVCNAGVILINLLRVQIVLEWKKRAKKDKLRGKERVNLINGLY